MFVNHRTQGFILKKIDRSENDQLFTIYTKDFGKLEVLGRAIRKISSKLKQGAETFYLSEIEFIQGKNYKTLTDAVLIDKFEQTRKDFDKMRITRQIAEVFDDLVRGQEKDENLWDLLSDAFNRLNKLEIRGWKLEILYYYFLWNLLSILGYGPELYICSLCRKKLEPQKLFFNPREGGVICQNHDKELRLSKKICPETVKILRILLKKDWTTFYRLKITPRDLDSLKAVSGYFLSEISLPKKD